jgi:hypothetical protein
MRIEPVRRRTGVASMLLDHLIAEVRRAGLTG